LKNLMNGVKKFSSLFAEKDAKEIIGNCLQFQDTTRTLISVIKEMNANPRDQKTRDNLQSTCKQLIDTIYKFFKACEAASVEFILRSTEESADSIGHLLQSLTAQNQEQLEDATKQSAKSCIKMVQLIKAKAAKVNDNSLQNQLNASCDIIEKSTLDILNESRRIFFGRLQPTDELTTLASKIILEYRQLRELLNKETIDRSVSTDDQLRIYQDCHRTLARIVGGFKDVIALSELDKALVGHLERVVHELSNLINIAALSPSALLDCVKRLSEVILQIKQSIEVMSQKSRDPTMKRKLAVLADALLSYSLIFKFSGPAHVLKLNVASEEAQLVLVTKGVSNLCGPFYQEILELRS